MCPNVPTRRILEIAFDGSLDLREIGLIIITNSRYVYGQHGHRTFAGRLPDTLRHASRRTCCKVQKLSGCLVP